ncbi:hypothetical protein ACJMK2_030998 [Sinanodonta woodiana]|uniref:Ig-like domain-containing protein n=1 Tax=Sinanodonta woodiana TaxID=1069815 RepID=A0ABD3WY04_SINWO
MTIIFTILVTCILPSLTKSENIMLEYYKDVTFECDDLQINVSTISPPPKMHWILPSGKVISDDFQNTSHIHLGGSMNLTIQKIDDEDFGRYFCVIVFKNQTINVVSHGLNVDGPFYGDLLERYRHNAMIGGIAAAVLFVVIAAFCVVYHFRYVVKKGGDKGIEEIDGYNTKVYDNIALEMEITKPAVNGDTATDVENEKL